MSNSIKIGEWSFSPREAALSRGDERRRLENRAAETLEHLCRKNGEIVSHAELVEAVWQGRSLSPNSVAVVIADLRRALEDDARTPKYIETVPKRGYRMAASISVTSAGALSDAESGAAVAASPPGKRWAPIAVGVTLFIILSAAGVWQWSAKADSDRTPLAVIAVSNDTEDGAFDALTHSATELVTTELGRIPEVRILSGPTTQRSELVVSGSLIIWDGHPALSLRAVAPARGEIIWSGMASGPEAELPRQVRAEIEKLAQALSERENKSP